MSSAVPQVREESTPVDTDVTSPAGPPVDVNNTNYSSSTQSPQLVENNDAFEASGGPISPPLAARDADASGMDIYYDAEDKPLHPNNLSPHDIEADYSTNATSGTMSTAIEETPKLSSETATPAASETEETTSGATKQKSWASLFRNTAAANQAIVKKLDSEDDKYRKFDDNTTKQRSPPLGMDANSLEPGDVVSVERDPAAMRLAGKKVLITACSKFIIGFVLEALRNCEFVNRGPTFLLRGIINRGNWCYVNASLQALMACPPFYHFLRNLAPYVQRAHTSTPLLDAL